MVLLRERAFVRAAAVDYGYRHIQQPEVNRQLPAVMVPMVEHDGPQHADPWLGEHLFPLMHQTPIPLRRLFTHATEAHFRGSNAFVKSGVNFFYVAGSRWVEAGLRHVELVKLRDPGQIAWNARHVKGKLA